jgi:hypothetical protein
MCSWSSSSTRLKSKLSIGFSFNVFTERSSLLFYKNIPCSLWVYGLQCMCIVQWSLAIFIRLTWKQMVLGSAARLSACIKCELVLETKRRPLIQSWSQLKSRRETRQLLIIVMFICVKWGGRRGDGSWGLGTHGKHWLQITIMSKTQTCGPRIDSSSLIRTLIVCCPANFAKSTLLSWSSSVTSPSRSSVTCVS